MMAKEIVRKKVEDNYKRYGGDDDVVAADGDGDDGDQVEADADNNAEGHADAGSLQ